MTEEQVRLIWKILSELDVGELLYQDLYDAVEKVVGIINQETTVRAV